MNYLGLTVFAGNTPGLILDFDSDTKEYLVEFTDGRVIKTTKVFWDKTIPSEPDIAFYRQSSIGNGESLVYDPEIGWDIVSAMDEAIDIVDEPSDLGEWVDDYTAEDKDEHSSIEEKLDEVLDTLNDLVEKDKEVHDKLDGEDDSAVQDQDHDATEDSYWDRSTKPNPMAYDEEFPAGNYNERNPGTLNMSASTDKPPWFSSGETCPNCGELDIECECCPNCGEYGDNCKCPEAEYAPPPHKPSKMEQDAWRLLRQHDLNKEGKKECGCWDGYKRVPGTKPCAPGSCEKCDAARKESAAKKHNPEEAVKKVNTVPPSGVRANARRALKYIEEGKAGDGFQDATADRARRIAAGEALTEEHINRMHSFFERHAGGRSKKAKPGEITAWDVAWLAWGGDSGRSWAAKVDAQLHKARHPGSKSKHSREYWETGAPHEVSEGFDFDDEHMFSDIGGNSNVRHAEGEAQKNQHGDQEGNPQARGVGDDDVFFPEPPQDVAKIIKERTSDIENPNKNVWEQMLSHNHVREEAEWQDKHYAKNLECPTCSDPLVDGNCHVCGSNKLAHAERVDGLTKIARALQPQAAELGRLFGEALAGVRESVTEPSEDIYTIHVHGIDSDPSIGGTGNYNREHGDSPEYLKDVDDLGGFIDATPEVIMGGMPTVIELADSEESGEDNKVVKTLEKFFDQVFGDEFKKNKEESKDKKNSSLRTATGIPGAFGYGQQYPYQGGDSVAPQQTQQMGTQTQQPVRENDPNDNYCNVCDKYFVKGQPRCNASPNNPNLAPTGCEALKQKGMTRQYSSAVEDGGIVDIDNEPLEVGQVYRVFVGTDQEPDIVKVAESSGDEVSVVRVDSAFPENEGEPYKISAEQFAVEDIRFDKADQINPNEIGMPSSSGLEGTPEVNDDAGVGQQDLVGETDLSTGRKANTHIAGRHYYPNQQKEFINEPGKARNLDKLMLEGTHYLENETTASENFDDDFLFGV